MVFSQLSKFIDATLLLAGGFLTNYDIRTYRAMRFVHNNVDVIMVLEVCSLDVPVYLLQIYVIK